MVRKLMRDIDMHWPELEKEFPAFSKPFLIPARAITQEAPMYMRRYIDQDPDSYYIFIKGDVTKGNCSRDEATRFFFELLHERLGLPSSYERDEMLSPEMAVSKELLPADNDRNYENFFEEQLHKMRDAMDADAREQKMQDFEKEHGFRPDDPDIIDVDVDEPGAAPAQTKAVGAAQTRAVGMPKPIFYAIDIHLPAGGALGYNGPRGRLGARGPRGYLREAARKASFLHNLDKIFRGIKREFNNNPKSADVDFVTIGKLDPRTNTFDPEKCNGCRVVSFNNGTLTLEPVAKFPTLAEFLQAIIAAGAKHISDITKIAVKGWGDFIGVEPYPNAPAGGKIPRGLNFLFREPLAAGQDMEQTMKDFLNEKEKTGTMSMQEKRVYDVVICGLAEKLGVNDGVEELRRNMYKQTVEGRAATDAARKTILDNIYKVLEQIVSKDLDNKDGILTILNTWFTDHVRNAMFGPGAGRYLREADTGAPVSDILRAYNWAKTTRQSWTPLTRGLQAIAKCSPASDANARNASIHRDFNIYVFKYSDGRTTWIEEEAARPGNFNITVKDINDAAHEHFSKKYQALEATVVTIDELQRMTTVAEEDEKSDPENMMKEFVDLVGGQMSDNYIDDPDGEDADLEKSGLKTVGCHAEPDDYDGSRLGYGRAGVGDRKFKMDEDDVEEDEYRRPKNQPHNLHRVDESDAWVADIDADGKDDVQFIVYASSEEDARKEAENEIKSHKLKNAKVKSVRLKDEKSKDDDDIEDGDGIEEAELSQDDSDYIAALTGNTGGSSFPDMKNPAGSSGRQLRNILPPDEERSRYAGADDLEDESEDGFEMNESMVRFCDRLIRG